MSRIFKYHTISNFNNSVWIIILRIRLMFKDFYVNYTLIINFKKGFKISKCNFWSSSKWKKMTNIYCSEKILSCYWVLFLDDFLKWYLRNIIWLFRLNQISEVLTTMQSSIINTVKISKYICNARYNIKWLFSLKVIFYFNAVVITEIYTHKLSTHEYLLSWIC